MLHRDIVFKEVISQRICKGKNSWILVLGTPLASHRYNAREAANRRRDMKIFNS